jgi:hypothetical protein
MWSASPIRERLSTRVRALRTPIAPDNIGRALDLMGTGAADEAPERLLDRRESTLNLQVRCDEQCGDTAALDEPAHWRSGRSQPRLPALTSIRARTWAALPLAKPSRL